MIAIAGKAALPLESCMRNLAAELSWCRGWWVTQSLGGEGFGWAGRGWWGWGSWFSLLPHPRSCLGVFFPVSLGAAVAPACRLLLGTFGKQVWI